MSTVPGHDDGYPIPKKCWINNCGEYGVYGGDAHNDWSFIEPHIGQWTIFDNLRRIFFILPILIFYGCFCCHIELRDDERAPLIEELGEKNAYDRFYKRIRARATEDTDIPKEWRVLNAVVMCATISAPVILIATFIGVTFSWGGNLTDNTISEGIQYRPDREGMFFLQETMTGIAVFMAAFVSWCRQIQIAVYFREYGRYFGVKQAKKYRVLNVIGMLFNLLGYHGIVKLVSMDAARWGGTNPVHGVWAMVAFLSTGTFLLITTIITIKQRHVEYRRNIVLEEMIPRRAFMSASWYDAVLMVLLFVGGSVSLVLFFAEIAKANAIRSQVPEDERLNTFAYIDVFTSEWIAFFCFVSGIGVVSFNFTHHDIAWAIHDYLKEEVMLWPCVHILFYCFFCPCCRCCLNLDEAKERAIALGIAVRTNKHNGCSEGVFVDIYTCAIIPEIDDDGNETEFEFAFRRDYIPHLKCCCCDEDSL
eukprot:825193_1